MVLIYSKTVLYYTVYCAIIIAYYYLLGDENAHILYHTVV